MNDFFFDENESEFWIKVLEKFDFKSFYEKKLQENKSFNNFHYKLFLMQLKEGKNIPTCLLDIFSTVATCDDKAKGILFFPPECCKIWKRYDNIIDYHFADQGTGLKTVFKLLDCCLYPFPRYEAKAGPEEDWKTYDWLPKEVLENLKPEAQVRNYIPLLLKDLLIEMNIFKNPENIHKLQPYKAIWWS